MSRDGRPADATCLYLIRHGESLWNREGRWQGWQDPPLTEAGWFQAARLSLRFTREPLAAVYSSPLRRALDSARVLALPHGLAVQVVTALREKAQGEWEGRTTAEIQARDPEAYLAWRRNPAADPIPAAESLAALQQRALAALGLIARRHPGETVAVVTHGAWIKAVLLGVLGAPLDHLHRLVQANAAVNRLDHAGGRYAVRSVNDTCHLSVPARPPGGRAAGDGRVLSFPGGRRRRG